MNIGVIRGDELTDEHVGLWSDLAAADAALAGPYFTPPFTQAVAAVRDDVFVGIMEDGGRTVGFFPFQRRGRVGRPVGGALSDYQGVIVARDVEWSAEDLVRGCGLDVWEFDHLVASQAPFEAYHVALDESPVMDLTDGFEAYAQARREAGSKIVAKTARQRRMLERDVGPVRYETHTTDPAVMNQAVAWKSDQYVRSELFDVFGFGWTRELVERIHAIDDAGFAGPLSVLYAGDKLVAAHVGMRSRTVWHYWFPAYDPEFGRFSVGQVLLLEMAQAAQALGVTTIDLGKGSADYKDRLKSAAIPIAEGCVELPSLATAARKARRGAEAWVRRTPLIAVARIPGRIVRRIEKRRRFE